MKLIRQAMLMTIPEEATMKDLDKLRKELDAEWNDAVRVHAANRDGGSPIQSVAYDAGRVAGLKQAIEAIDRIQYRGLER